MLPTRAVLAPCKHVAATMSGPRAFVKGMTSLDLFPSTADILQRLEPNGLRADWLKVGCDFRRAGR